MLLFRDDAYRRACTARVLSPGEGGAVRLERTVFYAMGGGQPGDTGWLEAGGRRWRVRDTVKGGGPDDVLHLLEDGTPEPGQEVDATIDWARRYRHMRMHTALHLLCAVVEGDVTGGQIGETRSRLDFDIPAGAIDRDVVTAELNRLVAAALPVAQTSITEEELADRPELVRTLRVKPPASSGRVRLVRIGPEEAPVDLQPCGGTHVASTAEIGALDIVKVENKGRQNRRITLALRHPEQQETPA